MKEVIINLCKEIEKEQNVKILFAIESGSRAWRIDSKDSDYDILIVLNKDYSGKDENKILDLCYDIDLKYNIIIDAHLISEKEISSLRGKQPIINNALKSGIYA